MRARDRAALYVLSNWRVSKRLKRITAYLNSNRKRLEDMEAEGNNQRGLEQ